MGTYSLTVTPAPTQMCSASWPLLPLSSCGSPVTLSAQVNATKPSQARHPRTEAITFYDGTTPIPGTVSYMPKGRARVLRVRRRRVSLPLRLRPGGTHNLRRNTAETPTTGRRKCHPQLVFPWCTQRRPLRWQISATINLGQSYEHYGDSDGCEQQSADDGHVPISGTIANPVSGTPGTDASGNQTLTATAMFAPQYSGFDQAELLR